MSAASDPITLDELARLIRLLGKMGSDSDAEALAAAKFAVKWVAEHQTDWTALLVPEPDSGVVSVAVGNAAAAEKAEADLAYQMGFDAGLAEGAKRTHAAAMAAANLHAAQTAAAHSQWVPFGGSLNSTGPVQAQTAPLGGAGWQAVALAILDHAKTVPGVLRGAREEQFLRDILARGFRTLTQAQEQWLRDIAGRAGMTW